MSTSLDRTLRQAGRWVQWSAGLAATLLIVAGLIAILLLVVGIDAVLALPPAGLIVLNLTLLVALLIGLAFFARRWYQHRYRPRWVARRLEQRAQLSDNRLINALDLRSSESSKPSSSNQSLTKVVLERGDHAAAELKPTVAVDRRPLVVGARYAVIAAALIGGLYLLLPSLFHAVLPRLAEPFADHPPFTLVQFDVEVNPSDVIYGQPATIHARLSGPQAIDQAEVVFVDGDQRQPLIMSRQINVNAPAQAGLGSTGKTDDRFALNIERAEVSREFYISTPHGRSKRYRLDVRPVPLFERADVTYRYPAYTGWDDVTQPLPSRAIRVLVGTQLELQVQSNVALSGGQIVQAGKDANADAADGLVVASLQLRVDNPRIATGTIVVENDGRYRISLVGADGLPSPEPLPFEVKAVQDEAPDLYFNKPEARVVAPANWTVDIEVVARDDIGIDRVVLHRGINGWGPTALPLELEPPGSDRSSATASFDLESLGASPGDVITYFAVGYDNHPTEPRIAETDVYAIQVVSYEEWIEHRRMREGLREVRERVEPLLARLKELQSEREALLEELDELEAQLDAQAESGQPRTPEQEKAYRELKDRLQAYADEAEKLAGELKEMADQAPVYDFEKQIQDQMRAAAAGLFEQQAAAGELAAKMAEEANSRRPKPALMPLITKFRETDAPFGSEPTTPFDEVEEDLERLAAAAELSAEAERVRQVIVQQRSLAQRLAAFRNVEKLDTAQQLRASRLAKEQAKLRDELTEAQARLTELSEKHAERLPNMAGSAGTLAQKIASLRVDRDQDSAARLAEAGEGRYAAISAEHAADKLDSLLSDCQGMNEQGAADLDGCLKLPRQAWASQLSQLTAGLNFGMGPQGGAGAGMGGSMARMAVAGSKQGGDGESDAEESSAQPGGMGLERAGANRADQQGAPEQLNPDQTQAVIGIDRVLPGVPARYREEAEAYFRRLADEADEL